MSKGARLSEAWFRRGLWAIAVLFASFLIGLGNVVIGDLPKVEKTLTLNDFVAQPATREARAAVTAAQKIGVEARNDLAQAELRLRTAESDTRLARDAMNQWLATRRATERPDQDPEVLTRGVALEQLAKTERAARADVEAQQKIMLDAQQAGAKAQFTLSELEAAAQDAWHKTSREVELRVFLYRLALTLPLLLIAGWLWKAKRHSAYWPFVWGFIFFALFAFFFELVPYLPSYGGYVRYVVGLAVTAIIGRQAIIALNRYLERQRAAEARPHEKRREEMDYEVVMGRLAKSICPGCERAVDLTAPDRDFCPHCGIRLFTHCPACQKIRHSSFAHYCHGCGATAAPNNKMGPGQAMNWQGS